MEFMRAIGDLINSIGYSRPGKPCKKHEHKGRAGDRNIDSRLPYRGAGRSWSKSHGRKIVHKWRAVAMWHRWDLSRNRPEEYQVYECRWGDCVYDGETAELHYHVGRPRPEEKQAKIDRAKERAANDDRGGNELSSEVAPRAIRKRRKFRAYENFARY